MYTNSLFKNEEQLYKVIARQALSQKKCYKCYKDLETHKRCSIDSCNQLVCGSDDKCHNCTIEQVYQTPLQIRWYKYHLTHRKIYKARNIKIKY